MPVYFQLGIRMMHLTYQRRNMLGDGCAEPGNGGISDFGRHAIAALNRVGVIVDVAHSGWRTSLEAAKASAKPVVAAINGAGCREVCFAIMEHLEQLKAADAKVGAGGTAGGAMGHRMGQRRWRSR